MDKTDSARTPHEKHFAREEGMSVKRDLEKQIGDDAALAAFKAAKPQSMVGVWKGDPVADHPMHMVRADGTKITAPVELPNGEKAIPNAAYQITVQAHHVPAMRQRGFVLANAVLTPLGEKFPMHDPQIPNGTA